LDRKILAIFDCEENYAYRLMDFIGTKDKMPFEIHVFTRADSFFSFAKETEIECLLISENAYQIKIEQLNIAHIIILSENGENLNPALCHVNKYQSCENIVREVMYYYAEKTKSNRMVRTSSHKMRIIGIYTPATRCLQTTFSITLGQMLARQRKTLYLNFEAYSGFGKMLNRQFQRDLSDLVYYLNCARDKLFYHMEGMIETVNGLDFIPPAEIYQNLAGIRGTQWIDLFEEIERATEYEYLLLDLSDCVMDLWEILQHCDSVYTIVREDFIAAAKIEQYEKTLESMQHEEVLKKTKKWNLPMFKKLPLHFEELTYGDLAGYIRKEVFPDLLEGEEYASK